MPVLDSDLDPVDFLNLLLEDFLRDPLADFLNRLEPTEDLPSQHPDHMAHPSPRRTPGQPETSS